MRNTDKRKENGQDLVYFKEHMEIGEYFFKETLEQAKKKNNEDFKKVSEKSYEHWRYFRDEYSNTLTEIMSDGKVDFSEPAKIEKLRDFAVNEMRDINNEISRLQGMPGVDVSPLYFHLSMMQRQIREYQNLADKLKEEAVKEEARKKKTKDAPEKKDEALEKRARYLARLALIAGMTIGFKKKSQKKKEEVTLDFGGTNIKEAANDLMRKEGAKTKLSQRTIERVKRTRRAIRNRTGS